MADEQSLDEIRIRRSEPADAAALTALYSERAPTVNTLQLPYPSRHEWEARLTGEQKGYSLVAELGATLVGHAGLFPQERPRRRHVAGLGIAIHPDWQGRGIGSRMIEALLDLADNWLDIRRIELEVYTDNAAAIALYRKYGFVEEGVATAYAFGNGRFLDALRMARLRNTGSGT